MPATGSCRRLRRRGLSTVGSQALGCSRMCWCRSMQIINRSTVSLRSMLVKASTSTARRLQDGSAQPAICSRPWSMRFAINVISATKLHADDRGPHGQFFVRGVATRRCRCSLQATGEPRREDSGPMSATTVHRATQPRLPSGSPTRPTARERTRAST